MLETVSEREKVERGELKVYRDVASSFGERPGLNALIDDLIAGKVERIWVECADRLSRVPALTRLVEHLAKHMGRPSLPWTEKRKMWTKRKTTCLN